MALLTLQSVSTAGLNPTFSAPTASDTIAATGGVMWYHMKFSGSTVQTFTIVDGGRTAAGAASANLTMATPASGDRVILIPQAAVNPATGLITVTFSAALTGITTALMGL